MACALRAALMACLFITTLADARAVLFSAEPTRSVQECLQLQVHTITDLGKAGFAAIRPLCAPGFSFQKDIWLSLVGSRATWVPPFASDNEVSVVVNVTDSATPIQLLWSLANMPCSPGNISGPKCWMTTSVMKLSAVASVRVARAEGSACAPLHRSSPEYVIRGQFHNLKQQNYGAAYCAMSSDFRGKVSQEQFTASYFARIDGNFERGMSLSIGHGQTDRNRAAFHVVVHYSKNSAAAFVWNLAHESSGWAVTAITRDGTALHHGLEPWQISILVGVLTAFIAGGIALVVLRLRRRNGTASLQKPIDIKEKTPMASPLRTSTPFAVRLTPSEAINMRNLQGGLSPYRGAVAPSQGWMWWDSKPEDEGDGELDTSNVSAVSDVNDLPGPRSPRATSTVPATVPETPKHGNPSEFQEDID